MSWKDTLKCGSMEPDEETKGPLASAAKLVGSALTGDDEEKSDIEKLYGTHRQGGSDIADSMRNMIEQLQEIEEILFDWQKYDASPEIQNAFDEATQSLGKLQALLV